MKQLDVVVSPPAFLWDSYLTLTNVIFDLDQRCPEAMAHVDFASYSRSMRRLLFQNFMYSVVTSIANVVIFAAYFSQCGVYFEKCGQRCLIFVAFNV